AARKCPFRIVRLLLQRGAPVPTPQQRRNEQNPDVSHPRDPEELEAAAAPAVAEIAPGTRLGAAHLTVSDLDASLLYWHNVVGLAVLGRDGGRATLGAGAEELLVLVEEPGARPADGYTGLYHVALLVPARVDLARWLAHAARDSVALTGLS